MSTLSNAIVSKAACNNASCAQLEWAVVHEFVHPEGCEVIGDSVPKRPRQKLVTPASVKWENLHTKNIDNEETEACHQVSQTWKNRTCCVLVLMRALNKLLVVTKFEEKAHSVACTEVHIACKFKRPRDLFERPLLLLVSQTSVILTSIRVAASDC